jgi:hypothetical protein
MSTFVRTNHTTFSLHQISKMVAVLLLIFLPVLASANPDYQSSNRYSNPSTVGASSMQYQLESYKMANTSTYQVGTTYNPAQTVYEPFSSETPSDNNGLGGSRGISSNRRNGWGTPSDPERDPEPKPVVPIGDAWSLLFFAALAAGVIALRKKQTA